MREARLRLEADLSTIAFSSDSTAVRGIERIERAAAGLTGASAAERAVLAGASYARYWTAGADAGTFVAELEPLLSRENALDEPDPGQPHPHPARAGDLPCRSRAGRAAILNERLEHERRRGDVPLLGGYLNARSRILAFIGELREAEQVAREGLAYDTVFVHSWGQPSMLAALITPLVWMGRIEEAQQALEERGPDGPIGPVGTFHIARMELRCAQGRYAEAVADAELLIERLAARRHAGVHLLDVAAATFLAAGDHERAAQVARDGLEVDQALGSAEHDRSPSAGAGAGYTRGAAAHGGGRPLGRRSVSSSSWRVACWPSART